jgi:hypothetical protein
MNPKIKTRTLRLTTAAGILLGTAVAASAAANSVVTFSVDMTAQIQNSAFIPGTSQVSARGSFNGWGESTLTNNPAAEGLGTNIYTGTFADTSDSNGGTMYYKYYIDTGTAWEADPNRQWGVSPTNGGHVYLPTYFFNNVAPTNIDNVTCDITFQVDMTQQIALGNFPSGSTVYARGNYNGWTSAAAMTNDPAASNPNLWSTTLTSNPGLPDSPQGYKFYIDTGGIWEGAPPMLFADGSGNRIYNLLVTNGALVLPPVYFNDQAPVPPVTNNVTFQVDMTYQRAMGRFNPPPDGSDYVEARGSFNSWNGGFSLTNDPAATGLASNVYRGVYTMVGSPSSAFAYKFWSTGYPSNYETPSSTGGGNRSGSLLATNGDPTLPDVYFADQQLGDITPSNTVVVFSVNMTNAMTTGGVPFNPSADKVYINGDFLGWWGWGALPPAQYEVTNYPAGSQLYQIELLIPVGSALGMTYKYSINGADNEAGFSQNHGRYIRQAGTYTFPMDTFANQHQEPATSKVVMSAPSGGYSTVSWLGHPGIYLQSGNSLTGGAWQNLLGTDGTTWKSGFMSPDGFVSTTNYPTSGGPTYLRWVKPQTVPVP